MGTGATKLKQRATVSRVRRIGRSFEACLPDTLEESLEENIKVYANLMNISVEFGINKVISMIMEKEGGSSEGRQCPAGKKASQTQRLRQTLTAPKVVWGAGRGAPKQAAPQEFFFKT